MAKKKSLDVLASIVVKWDANGAAVIINDFEKLSPVKIDKCFQAALKEWYRLRSLAITERRKREREEGVGVEG